MNTFMRYLMLAAVLGFGLAACEPNQPGTTTTTQDAGQAVETTTEDAGQAVDDAAQDVGQGLDDALDNAEDAGQNTNETTPDTTN